MGAGEHERTEWRPQGTRAGWVAGENLYLELEAALTAAQRVGQATGSPIGVTPKTLAKRLHERGFLRSTEQTHGELRVRRTLEGRRRRVLHLPASAITLEESGQPGQSGESEPDSAPGRASEHGNGRVSWPDDVDDGVKSGQGTRPEPAQPRPGGRDGRIGRVVGAQEPWPQDTETADLAGDIAADPEAVEWSA